MVVAPSRAGNLPAELTSFVGRRREVAVVRRLLSMGRLVALAGVGSFGKPRLALRAASEFRRAFDGIWLVDLAGLTDPSLVAQTVAAIVGLRDQSARAPLSVLSDFLAPKRALLVLDNCEHLLDACAVLADALLRAAPELRILATSRQSLRIDGEFTLAVTPLSTPEWDGPPRSLKALEQYEAVNLFADRARLSAWPGLSAKGFRMTTPVREGDLLWTPSAARVANARLTAFTSWLAAERGLRFDDYHALWRWSVDDLEGFWQAVWDYCGVDASVPPERVLGRRAMPGAEWFPGARLNYAQHVLRREQPGKDALLFLSETTPVAGLDLAEFAGQVRILGTRLRGKGLRPGDRVASPLPNIPQTVIAMLATTSIGAIWTGCSPDFGWRGVLDRFRHLRPKVLFCVDGYTYGGKTFDRREELRQIRPRLDRLSPR